MHPLLLSIVAQRNRSAGGVPTPPGVPSDAIDITIDGYWSVTQSQGDLLYTRQFIAPTFDGTNYNGGYVFTRVAQVNNSDSIAWDSIGTWAVNLPAGTLYVYTRRNQGYVGSSTTSSSIISSANKSGAILSSAAWTLTGAAANSGTSYQLRSGSYATNSTQFSIAHTVSAFKVQSFNVFFWYKPA